ncbi:hypothetical protein SAMN04488483_2788 [Pseudomonas helmanticensis]|uniref:Uncharacterized protein n=1 Tax=Pseudomonas helmanticensis TaxID=1471381 RepID=A0ACD2U6B4_9PSED|nr:hypothetical protein [Pseudomonas helmanticensis]SMQ26166.1 hypothetical protein SAMN04488483_2788 [Pseudomonas helmanticensis]
MTFGFRTFDAQGRISIDVTDRALRVIHSMPVKFADSGTFALPGFNSNNATAYVVGNEVNKRPVWAFMRDGYVEWGFYGWWSNAYHTAGTLYVVAKS